jgi:hypothetical protein
VEAKHEKEDWIDGEKTEDVVAFLDRLYTAKRKVEERIAVLGGVDTTVSHQFSPFTVLSSNYLKLGETSNHSRSWSEVSFIESHPQKSKFFVILHGVYGSSASFAARAILADRGEFQEPTGVCGF